MAEAGTIDSLQIEIEASSKSAVQQINNLAKAFKNLKAATDGGLNIGNFKKELGKLGNNEYTKIEKLAQALQGLKNVKLDDKIGNSMLKIADACELIEQEHIDKLTKFGNALQAIKSISTEGYDKLPSAILNIAAAADSVKDETIDRLNRLTKALARLRGMDLSGVAAILHEQNVSKVIDRNPNNPKDSVSANSGGKSGKSLVDNQGASLGVSDAVKNGAMGFFRWHIQRLFSDFQKLGSQAISAAKAIGGHFMTAIKSATSAVGRFAKNLLTAPFERLTSRVTKLTGKLGNLVSSFKRVLFYRAVRTVIKELGDAMKEGEENAYWYTKTIGDATHYIAEAYDTFASASATMKNQVGAAWATLFANIEPLITRIIVMVQRAAEVVTMFFAKLGGKNTYLKAIDYSKDWAEETDKGAKAAKEWRNQLMAFDEINRLEAPTDSTSGKGSGTDKDYGAMFVEEEVDPAIGELADRLRELWESQDWKGLGELIGQTLNDLFPSRDKWKEWGAYIGNGIDGIIQTIYYALDSIDFSEWGSRIADGLNAAIDEIDFYIAGELFTRKFTALIDFIGGFLGGLDWHDIGQAIGDFFRGALDEGTAWLNDHDFGEIAQKFWGNIKEAIMGFDIDSFAQSLGNFLITAMNSIADFASNTPWDDVVNTVLSSIETFAQSISQDGRLAESFNNLKESLISAFELAVTTFGNWVGTKDWNEIGGSFMSALTRLLEDLGRIASAIPWTTLANALIDFIGGALDSFTTWLEGKDFTDLGEKFNTKITTALSNLKTEELTSKLSSAVSTTLIKLGDWINGADPGDIAAKIGDFLVRAIEGVDIQQLLTSITYLATSVLMNVPEIILGILESEFHMSAEMFRKLGVTPVADFLDGIAEKTGNARQELKTKFTDPVVENVRDLLGTNNAPGSGPLGQVGVKAGNDLIEGIGTTIAGNHGGSHSSGTFEAMGETVVDSIGSGIDNKLPMIHSRVKNAVSETTATVTLELGKVAETSEREWQRYSYAADSNLQLVTSTADSNTSQLAQTMESNLSGIQQSADTSFNGVKEAITSATSDITNESTSDTQTLYNDVTGIYNNIHSEAVRVFSDIARNVPIIMNGMAQQVESSVQQMEQSFTNMQYTVSGAFDTIRANIESAIYAIQGIDWSIPAPHLPHITWYYDTVYSDDGSSFNIPQFNVEWYAKGGILDNPTLFGMGDAGAEALVPLERNTEWIGKVAAEMNRQSEKNEGRDESNDDVIDALYTICDRIIRAIPDGGDDMDMDSLARALTKVQRRQARAMG